MRVCAESSPDERNRLSTADRFMHPRLCNFTSKEGDVADSTVTRAQLIDRLNDDLSREYQAIIAYVVYSKVLTGAEYMNIAKELEKHAAEELRHALIIAKHIDYLGGMP